MQLAIVLAAVLVFILALLAGLNYLMSDRRPAEEQLRQRFARGEIGEAEYLRSIAILEHGSQLVRETERAPLPGESRSGDS